MLIFFSSLNYYSISLILKKTARVIDFKEEKQYFYFIRKTKFRSKISSVIKIEQLF